LTFDDDGGTMRGKGAPKVVLITDGGDVNDTLALLLTALRALQGDLELKGIITCGRRTHRRGHLTARRRLGCMGLIGHALGIGGRGWERQETSPRSERPRRASGCGKWASRTRRWSWSMATPPLTCSSR